MLHLYDLNKNKIKGLVKYKDYCIESTLSTGDKVLSFIYPSKLAKEIKEECYIRTKEHEFVVKEVNSQDDWTSITAVLNVENLEGQAWEHFSTVEQTIGDCLALALAGTGWTVQVNNVTKKRTIRKTNCSTWEIIQQAKKTYLVEIEFDTINKIIKVSERLGSDKGAYFMESLNLKLLEIQSNSYEFYSRLIAIGKDNLKTTVENYSYSTKVKTLIWKDERYTVLESLREDATAKLEELSKPYRAYRVDVIDLANMSDKYSLLSYSLGDTITLISKDKGIKEKQRIVKIKEYPEEPERNTCEIANSILSFVDMQKDFQDTSDTVNNITSDNGTIAEGAIRTTVEHITINKADIQDLNVVRQRVGTLETNKLDANEAYIKFTQIDEALIAKADVVDLTAANIKFNTAEGGTMSLQTLLSKEVFTELASVGKIVAGSSIIAEGAIGSAQISSLDVTKLNAGDISTAKFTILGTNGRLKIVNNRLQVFANKPDLSLYERVSLGDVNGDGSVYGLRIRGADGVTVLLDETGVKREGITDGSINNAKIGADANISGTKLDIASVVTSINNGTTTIQGSKVFVDGKTLDLSFSTLKTTVTSQGESISSQSSQITALDGAIKLKLDTQTYNTKMSAIDGSISTINTSLSKATSDISVLQGKISLKVEQTYIDDKILSTDLKNIITDNSITNLTDAVDGLMTIESIKGRTLKNEMLNSGFREGVNKWFANGAILSVSNNIMSIKGTGGNNYPYAYENNIFNSVTDKYYIKVKARVTSDKSTQIAVGNFSGSGYIEQANPVQNVWYLISGIKTGYTSGNFLIIHTYADSAAATDKVMEVEYALCINLTVMFGAGKEPSKEWCDKNIAWFDGIKSVGEQEENKIVINSVGKNLFDGQLESGDIDVNTGLNITSSMRYRSKNYTRVKPNTSYSFYRSIVSGNMGLRYYDINEKYVGSFFTSQPTFTINTAENCFYIKFIDEANNPSQLIQIEEGTTSTPYEPYKSSNAEVQLKEPLRGLIIAYNDEKYGDKLIRRTGHIIFNGDVSEVWNASTLNTTNYARFYIYFNKFIPAGKNYSHTINSYSSRRLSLGEYSDDVVEGWYSDSSFAIKILKAKLSTVDVNGFKAWLKNNPITVVYELANPLEETLNLSSISSFKNGTLNINNIITPTISLKYPITFGGALVNNVERIVTVDKKIDTKLAEIKITTDNITSRVASTESNISTINGQVSSLTSRVSSAEQKITDDAIIATVRTSTAYKGDLNAKASQTDLNSAVNRISTAESQITQLNTSITSKVSKAEFDGILTRVNSAEEQITPTAITDKFIQSVNDGKAIETGIIKHSKDGIEVTHSNINTKTIMDATGFKIINTSTEEVIGQFTETDGKAGFTTVVADEVIANNILIMQKKDATYYVNGTTGNDITGDGTSGKPFKTIFKALSMINKIFNDYNRKIYIYVYGNCTENIVIENFTGIPGMITDNWPTNPGIYISLDRNVIFNGTFRISNCDIPVIVDGNRTAWNDSGGALIKQNKNNSIIFSVLNSKSVVIANLRIQGTSKSDVNIAVSAMTSNVVVRIIDVCDMRYGVIADYFSQMMLFETIGSRIDSGITARGHSNIRVMNQSSLFSATIGTYQQDASIILPASYNFRESSFNPSAAPPPPTTQNYTTRWDTTQTKSWRDNWGWRSDNSYIYQGQYSSNGVHRGFMYFDSSSIRNALSGSTINNIYLYLARRASGGASAATNIRLYGHQYDSPSGGTGLYVDYGYIGAWAWGESKWVTIPTTVAEQLKNGTIRGLALYEGSSNYAIFEAYAKLEINYTK